MARSSDHGLGRSAIAPTAVLRFHLRSGVRLALRAMVPLLVPFIAMVGLSESPSGFIASLAVRLTTASPDPFVPVILAATSIGIAAWAAPRLTNGISAWIRHLPVTAAAHRRSIALALAAAQAPILALVALLAIGVLLDGRLSVSVVKLAGTPIAALGAAYTVLPVRRTILVCPLGLTAAVASLAGNATGLATAVLALVAAEIVAGPILKARGVRRRGLAPASLLPALISGRALGTSAAGLSVFPLLALGASWLFVTNNQLDPAHTSAAVRLGGSLAIVFVLAALSDAVAARRPAWPWARSLPWSSARRVAVDAVFLAVHALPAVLIAALINVWGAVALLGTIPLLSIRASAAIRNGVGDRIGASGRVLAEGILATCLITLQPWLALVALALLPAALRSAARSEQAIKPTRWSPLHHLAAGDPLSWSG
jgi:hypothetical protein